jgi:hypothetical protein
MRVFVSKIRREVKIGFFDKKGGWNTPYGARIKFFEFICLFSFFSFYFNQRRPEARKDKNKDKSTV